ncbi:hypothetical protein ACX83H_18420 [Burkholderia pseudomallei]|uniref:hypothetical protein n=2 Tax=Burkholderia pseudomallei TaxID=28450 RepID=UPI00030962E1|nr:hypothetical protein [Burkholderia pseudomallei]
MTIAAVAAVAMGPACVAMRGRGATYDSRFGEAMRVTIRIREKRRLRRRVHGRISLVWRACRYAAGLRLSGRHRHAHAHTRACRARVAALGALYLEA